MTKNLKNTFTITSLKEYQFEITTLILALVVRLINISKSIWLDEAWALKFASASFSDILNNQWERNPPLYYLILKVWTTIFGTSELSLRLPSIIFGTLSILLFYLLLKRLVNLPVAQIGMLFAAVNPALIDISQTARTYALLCLCSVGAWYGLQLWKAKPNFVSASILGVFSSLMIYSHHFGILNFTALLCYSFYLTIRGKIKIIPTTLIYFVVGLSYLPYLPFISSQSHKLSQTGFWIPEFSLAGLFQIFDYLVLASDIQQVGMLVCLLALLIILIFTRKEQSIFPMTLWIICPMLLAIIYSKFSTSIFLDRYFITLSYPIIALFAVAISKIRVAALRSALLFVYLFASIICVNKILLNVKENWQDIALKINTNYQPGDLVLVHPLPYKYPFNYYSNLPVATIESLQQPNFLQSYRRIWLVEYYLQQNYLQAYLSEFSAGQDQLIDSAIKISLRERLVPSQLQNDTNQSR